MRARFCVASSIRGYMIVMPKLPLIIWAHKHNAWWFLLAAVLLCGVWYVYLSRNRIARSLDKMGTLLRYFSARKNLIKAVFASCAIICLFVALLHPQWGLVSDEAEQRGRDLLIALDVSRSMLAQDVQPDRLTCAKQVIMRVAQALETDRVSLIIFSEKARIYCPLTKDIDLVKSFLEHLDYTTLSSGTTCLDQPVRCALAQCQRNPERKHSILLMVSDGEDFSGSLDGLQEQAQSCGLTILVTGIGTAEGAPIPLYGEEKQRVGYLKDAHDRVVISRLNKPVLERLAKDTGGLALFVEKPDVSIEKLVARIKQFDGELQGVVRMPSLKEQYPWFLLVSFVCMLFEWML